MLFTLLVIGWCLLMLLLTTVRFLHVMIQRLPVAELPIALVARQLYNCCCHCTLSAVLLEVLLNKNPGQSTWKVFLAHLEVGGEGARLHRLLAASNIAFNLLRKITKSKR